MEVVGTHAMKEIESAAIRAGFAFVQRVDLQISSPVVVWPNADIEKYLRFCRDALNAQTIYLDIMVRRDEETNQRHPVVFACVFAEGIPHTFEPDHPSEEEMDADLQGALDVALNRVAAELEAEEIFEQLEAVGAVDEFLRQPEILGSGLRSWTRHNGIEEFTDSRPDLVGLSMETLTRVRAKLWSKLQESIPVMRKEILDRCYEDPSEYVVRIVQKYPTFPSMTIEMKTKIAREWLIETFGVGDKVSGQAIARATPKP
jgi:hypothetical protein